MARTGSQTPTPIEIQVLDYLKNKHRGRAADIARGLGLNQRSVWQAIQRVVERDFVTKDEFNIYTMTDKGKKWMDQEREEIPATQAVLVARLTHAKLSAEQLERLQEEVDEMMKGQDS